MASLLASLVDWIVDAVKQIAIWLTDLMYGVALHVWNEIITIVSLLFDFVLALAPQEVRDLVNSAPWEALYPMMDVAAWFLPVYEAMVIYFGALTLAALVRTGRWVLAFVPAIGAG
jgi:hypothetical protein